MGSMNRVFLLGNLGNTPELRHLESGQAMLKFRVATNAVWRDKTNPEKKHDRTDWHRIVVWGRRAEALSRVLDRGQRVMIEGQLRHNVVEEADGKKRTFTDIVAHDIQFAGSRPAAPNQSETLSM